MVFAITAILKEGAAAQLDALADEFNEHLSQPFRRILLAGALRDENGERAGYLAVIEATSHAEATAFLEQSPLHRGQLYEHAHVHEFAPEVGVIG